MRFEINLQARNVFVERSLNQMWQLAGMDDLEAMIEREGKYSIDNFFNDVFFQITSVFASTDLGSALIKYLNKCIVISKNRDCFLLRVEEAREMRLIDRDILRQFVLAAYDFLGPPILEGWLEKSLAAFDSLIVHTCFLIEIKRLLKERIRAIVRSKYGCIEF